MDQTRSFPSNDTSTPVRTDGATSSSTQPYSKETAIGQSQGQKQSAGDTAKVPKLTTSGLNIVSHSSANPTPTQIRLPKASTNIQWSEPIGLPIRSQSDEPLRVFRRAVGINSDLAPKSIRPGAAELGLHEPTGIYRKIIDEKRSRKTKHFVISWLLNFVHFAQIVIGATLTALGPNASRYTVPITVLGAVNTVIAGVLALLKGSGLPERLHKDETELHKLQEWIEETEALLATGIIGRDRRDIGVLVESAFRKYNSAKMSVENNRPDNYVLDPGSTAHGTKKTPLSSSLAVDGADSETDTPVKSSAG
ncbi:hypothetical protein BD289DRAFT_449005 [Coniella lustricola]|uniref:SMODS and SLOG-associating 2TM effector domain-containing protein n=1 Tax=Coniella lustricola TaxID=2025994 RepID=A0A2T3ANH1_9PEZI|nr:hypothetical protein BD289DRAFT_449005 [Coniella lustricola]